MVRVLCVGDLHGELIEVPSDERFDVVVCVGDLCSHELRVEKFAALKARLESGEETAWYDRIGHEAALEMIDASVEAGKRALERLVSFGVPVFLIPGNWDWTAERDAGWDELRRDRYRELVDSFENVIDIDEQAVAFEGLWFVGYGEVSGPELPIHERDERSEAEWEEHEAAYADLRAAYDELVGSCEAPPILVSHAPPFGSGLDAIDRPDSPRHGQHVGSLLARDLIRDHELLACLCGHMHEHPGLVDRDGTPVVNLGFGKNAWCLFDSEERSFEGLERLERARE